ncbi:MAG: hypothetical protein SF053_10160 [Bacteroidia bacterium]|nr:hypothetical protein [Bacteroidia bacterium]
MPFPEDIQAVWGALSQDPDSLREELSGRSYWLWDPPDGSNAEKPYAHLLPARENRTGCVKIANPKQLEAWFYPVDKALIPQQSGGQCEGVIWCMDAAERLCWVEMKMNIITHNTRQFEEILEEALGQVQNTISTFQVRWAQHTLSFLPANCQRIVIAVPDKPRRLRQTPPSFQRKARKITGGIKVFVLSKIELPQIGQAKP